MPSDSKNNYAAVAAAAATTAVAAGAAGYAVYKKMQGYDQTVSELRGNVSHLQEENAHLSRPVVGSMTGDDILLPGEKLTYLKPSNLAERFGKKEHTTPLIEKYEGQLQDFQDEHSIVTQTIYRNKDEHHKQFLRYLRAGPREKVYFNPKEVTAAIVTCGGLCPGLNNVIRGLTQMLEEYGVPNIYGVKDGYKGFKKDNCWIKLDGKKVETIHRMGGSALVCNRGNDDIDVMAEAIMKKGVNMLFIVGGDGTHRGADKIQQYMVKANYECSVVGIPKTIDNDIPVIDDSFGFATAVSEAVRAIEAGYVEATGAPNCIGLVKLMGRNSGFVVLHAVCAAATVDVALLPEMDISLPKLLDHIKQKIDKDGHIVVVVAEGCGATLMQADPNLKDAGGNVKLPDVGVYLKDKIMEFAKANGRNDWTVKYIDPTYMIRAVPANPGDSTYCHVLAHNAVHGAMAGYTGFSCGKCDQRYVMLPFKAITGRPPRQVNTAGRWFARMIMFTGQPSFLPPGHIPRHSSALITH
ncbi:6-phosphofructokinase, alpha subunit [Perkinsus olseni]|uniref:6-phosphofructokinase, alpha subunit n=1 Tax=Perkinsus olseni TaxID=32597 RepID=A0A7J6LG58_PEROL|nr:6-phosphofructokinase, alpha subunit [Perkinsus olseni]